MHYLWNDCETSGKNYLVHELWQYYGAIYNEKLEFVDEIELFLKPDDWQTRKIISELEAEAVTGISDIQAHMNNPRTITYSEGAKKLVDFLSAHKIPNKRKHFRMSGHNVSFDRNFIENKLFPEENEGYEKLVHHRLLDTLAITTFLQDMDMLPSDLGSLTSLVEYYNIKLGQAHNAKDDVKMNVEVYRAMRQSLAERKGNLNMGNSTSLLSIIEMV